ncbi:MAG: FAD-dependent oxidoreductase, partial [Nakamurella sp.]
DHDASYASMVEGHAVPFVVTIPTLLDPSLAPPGEHLLIVCSLVSYEHASWRSAKDDILVQQQRQLIAMYPQLEGRFTFAEAATPRTMERYTLNSSGAIYGWEATPDQSGFDRLPRQTPIAGLSLAGHWTQPGSGVMSVLVSGAQTAQLLLGLPDVNSLFASLPEPVSVA